MTSLYESYNYFWAFSILLILLYILLPKTLFTLLGILGRCPKVPCCPEPFWAGSTLIESILYDVAQKSTRFARERRTYVFD